MDCHTLFEPVLSTLPSDLFDRLFESHDVGRLDAAAFGRRIHLASAGYFVTGPDF